LELFCLPGSPELGTLEFLKLPLLFPELNSLSISSSPSKTEFAASANKLRISKQVSKSE